MISDNRIDETNFNKKLPQLKKYTNSRSLREDEEMAAIAKIQTILRQQQRYQVQNFLKQDRRTAHRNWIRRA
jgi:hypothetical protein